MGVKKNLNKVLLLMQLPPPVHGVSMMNQEVWKILNRNPSFDTTLIPLMFANKISNVGVFSIVKVIKTVEIACQLIWYLIKKKPNLIYFTLSPIGFAFYRDAIFVFIVKLFRKKIIFHLHGKGIKTNSQNYFKALLYRWIFRGVDVIALSQSLCYDFEKIHSRGKLYILPNGIQEISYKKMNRNHSKLNLLFLSNLILEKGILDMIEALGNLTLKNDLFSLKIVGEPVNITKEELKSLIEKKGLQNVEILGGCYGEKKNKILEKSDVLIFPTKNECFPLVILEAMQFGLAIVSTNNGAIPDMLDYGDAGLIVDSGDVDGLTESIEKLISDENLRMTISQNAYRKFKKGYTLKTFEKNLLQMFSEIKLNA